MMLTGGEKYNVKNIIIKINDIYPKIKDIISDEKYMNHSSNLNELYNHTLEIFMLLSQLTINIINSTPDILACFNLLQEVHYYKGVNGNNKNALIEVVNKLPTLQEALIKLVEDDTTNRDSVLKQIMDELGIVDPNAKKKRTSLW